MNDLINIRRIMTARRRSRSGYDTDDRCSDVKREEECIKRFLKHLDDNGVTNPSDMFKVLDRYYWERVKYDRYAKYLPQFMIYCCENKSYYKIREILLYLNKEDLDMVMNDYMSNDGKLKLNSEFIDLYEKIQACDAVLDNMESISKRFNLDELDGLPPYAYCKKMCNYIDTYDIPPAAKMFIALGCILSNSNYNVKYVPELQTQIVDYFMTCNAAIPDDMLDDIVSVLKSNIFADKDVVDRYIDKFKDSKRFITKRMEDIDEYISTSDLKDMCKSLLNNDNKQNDYTKCIDNLLSYNYEDDQDTLQVCKLILSLPLINSKCNNEYIYSVMNKYKDHFKDNVILNDLLTTVKECDRLEDNLLSVTNEAIDFKAKVSTVKDKTKVVKDKVVRSGVVQTTMSPNRTMTDSSMKGICDDFRMSQDKSPNAFKRMIQKIYTKQPEDIINGLPNVFGIIRVVFILGTFAIPIIGPVIAVVSTIADRLISMHMNEANAKELRSKLKEEKRKVQEKLDKKSDKDKELTLYMEELDKSLNKVNDYLETITDDTDDGLDMGFDMGDDDLFGESDNGYFDPNSAIYESTIKLLLSMELFNDIITLRESDNISNIDTLIPVMAKQRVLEPAMEIMAESYTDNNDKNDLYDALYHYVEDRSISFSNRASILESINIMDSTQSKNDIYTSLLYSYTALSTMNNIITEAEEKKEGIKSKLSKIVPSKKEFKFNPSTMKLALAKFKGDMRNLSTKEKSASQTLDVHMTGLVKSIQRAMTNDRREAIIKGSVIPSFSKTIKSAIAIGGLSLVNPVLGIIAGVGSFAMSKGLNAKEKKLIYDEIDVELKVIEKEIQIAENDNDMKKYRFLLQMQRRLQRERNRIKYGFKANGRDLGIPKDRKN